MVDLLEHLQAVSKAELKAAWLAVEMVAASVGTTVGVKADY
jgi:hypothetical protein